MKKLLSIKFYATLAGTIWQNDMDATKEITREFTPKPYLFTTKWEGLKNALSLITKDGDFQYCKIAWGCMVIRWHDGKYYLERQVDIPVCKLTTEYLDK